MSSEQTWQIDSTSLENTLQIASEIGSKLKGGEVIELVSDLGGGKTAFVKGLVAGMGSSDSVSSPSFTLTNEYAAEGFRLLHYDLYRLREAGVMRHELTEVCGDPKKVVVIEWADIVADVLPDEHVRVHITSTGETRRTFTCTFPQSLAYLFPDNT
jgi:tRNA threonylcarbamoyladenosine biosynthesis protein TsaE